MKTDALTPEILANSVVAVPPLARDADYKIDQEQNQRIVSHLEKGGVTTLLYGGNANFYHVSPSEYPAILQMLSDISGPNTSTIPAVGPSFGLMMDQAEMLKDFEFPTAMVLPQVGLTTDAGVQKGIRLFAERLGKPVVVYLKHEGYLSARATRELVDDGIVSWVKYAVVREDSGQDPLLTELVDQVDPRIIVSGIGEQPAIIHMRQFGVIGFTSGCVCIAPRLSMEMLTMIQKGEIVRAEEIRGVFKKLENLRNEINPIRVLHDAVSFAGIAKTGPILPLLSPVEEKDLSRVREAAQTLFAEN